MLAYKYEYGLEAPPDQVSGLVRKHEQACERAGPTICQITGGRLEAEGKDDVHGTLTLRAATAWLSPFREGLDRDAGPLAVD
jgi:hypothetical protein